jgi:predicted MFS family arabinose efflux permease
MPGFWPMVTTSALFSVALFTAFGFIVDFATDEGVSSERAALLVGIVGASSVVGRLGLAAFVGRVHVVRLVQGCLAAQPVAFLLWYVAGGSYAPLVLFAVLLGVSYGGYVSLGPETAAVLVGVAGLGGVMGLLFLSAGIGGLIGPPVAGALADASDGGAIAIAFALAVSLVALGLSLRIPARRSP